MPNSLQSPGEPLKKPFAKANKFPGDTKIYSSYESLFDHPEINAVYVPLPTSLHVKWVRLAAQKKKHILSEKHVGLNVKEVDQIIEAYEDNGVQIMGGTMWVHNPRTKKMKEFLSDPKRFGQLKMAVVARVRDEETAKNLLHEICTSP